MAWKGADSSESSARISFHLLPRRQLSVGRLQGKPFRVGGFQIVLFQASQTHEELLLRIAKPIALELPLENRKGAEHVCRLEQAVVGGRHLPNLRFQEGVEERVHEVGYLLLAVVVIDDYAGEGLQETEVVPQERVHLAGYPRHHRQSKW